jgi:thioredoxin 1
VEAVQLHHFDSPSSECAHALCVVRLTAPLAGPARRAIVGRLVAASAFAAVEAAEDEEVDDAPSAFLVGAWVPRTAAEHEAAVAALRTVEGEAAWLFAVETTIDAEAASEDEDEEDEDEDEEDESSHWRFGPPPSATEVPFPVERYPEIVDEYDWEDFGIALKLAAPAIPGEAEVLEGFHRLWVMAYVDPRAEEVPFRNTSVTFDEAHRSALVWIDRFCPPATVTQLVQHLLWIADRIHTVVPVVHARFGGATMEQKYHHMMEGSPAPFVLAGNPLVRTFHEGGEAAAATWAETQTTWSPKELAAMYVELGTEFDPDEPEPSANATRMFDRALALDPANDDAGSYAMQAFVRSGRVDEALARARASSEPSMRGFTFALIAEHAPARLSDALPLLDATTLDGIAEEKVGEILATLATAHVEALSEVLPHVPRTAGMVAHLYNASHKCEDPAMRMRMLEIVMDLPAPELDSGPHRVAFTFAFNNACVYAHGMKDFARAREIADRAQQYAEENPYIFHGAACAYVAVGELDKAMYQVERAVARDYDHLDQLEKDTDLGELLHWPRFEELFAARREKLAKSEPVIEIGSDAFAASVLEADRPVLVDFSATWCGPCKRQAPILDKMARGSEGRFRIVKVDIDASPDLAERYDAQSVPTLVVFAKGAEVARTVGLSQADELVGLLAKADV